MSEGKRGYVLWAWLQRAETQAPDVDEAMAGQPAARRLNRMERVALAYDGQLARRSNDLLLMSFNTAKAAVLGACEMQRRCAGLPQVAGGNLALRIGIHRAALHQSPRVSLSLLRPAERRDLKRRFGFDVARQLSEHAPDNGIVISSLVAGTLEASLLESSLAKRDEGTDLPMHILNWHHVLMRSLLSPAPVTPASLATTCALVFSRGRQRFEFGRMNPCASFGRDPGCDIVLSNPFASRLHALVEIGSEGCFLTDQSANGTCIQMPDGTEVLIRDKPFRLPNHGRLAFGHSIKSLPDAVFEFEIDAC